MLAGCATCGMRVIHRRLAVSAWRRNHGAAGVWKGFRQRYLQAGRGENVCSARNFLAQLRERREGRRGTVELQVGVHGEGEEGVTWWGWGGVARG